MQLARPKPAQQGVGLVNQGLGLRGGSQPALDGLRRGRRSLRLGQQLGRVKLAGRIVGLHPGGQFLGGGRLGVGLKEPLLRQLPLVTRLLPNSSPVRIPIQSRPGLVERIQSRVPPLLPGAVGLVAGFRAQRLQRRQDAVQLLWVAGVPLGRSHKGGVQIGRPEWEGFLPLQQPLLKILELLSTLAVPTRLGLVHQLPPQVAVVLLDHRLRLVAHRPRPGGVGVVNVVLDLQPLGVVPGPDLAIQLPLGPQWDDLELGFQLGAQRRQRVVVSLLHLLLVLLLGDVVAPLLVIHEAPINLGEAQVGIQVGQKPFGRLVSPLAVVVVTLLDVRVQAQQRRAHLGRLPLGAGRIGGVVEGVPQVVDLVAQGVELTVGVGPLAAVMPGEVSSQAQGILTLVHPALGRQPQRAALTPVEGFDHLGLDPQLLGRGDVWVVHPAEGVHQQVPLDLKVQPARLGRDPGPVKLRQARRDGPVDLLHHVALHPGWDEVDLRHQAEVRDAVAVLEADDRGRQGDPGREVEAQHGAHRAQPLVGLLRDGLGLVQVVIAGGHARQDVAE